MNGQKPNIILITMDELRKDALSCYGNEAISTPNLDRLAEQSIKFSNAYTVSPWCLPSRCAILTGQYPHNSGAYSNFRKCELSTGIPNLFKELRGNNYKTSVFGKCHFTPVPYESTRSDITLPYEQTREYYVGLGIDHLDLQDGKQVSVWFKDDYSRELEKAGYLNRYRDAIWNGRDNKKVFEFPGPAEWHPDSWVGRKAQEFIENYSKDEPLFSWISFSGPHYPFDPPKEYLKRVEMSKDSLRSTLAGEFDDEQRIHHKSYHGDGRGIIDGAGVALGGACKNYTDDYWHQLRQYYYANVVQIDDYIGNILETVERKFGDNTLIICTADHGEMLGNHGLWGKGDCGYEDVLNVPLFVKYPGELHGVEASEKVMLIDIMATCMKAANLNSTMKIDGRDFRESTEKGGYSYVFAEGEGFISVSDGRYKYIHVNKNNREHYEMFDLKNDPKEFKNIVNEVRYSEKLAELRKQVTNLLMNKLLI